MSEGSYIGTLRSKKGKKTDADCVLYAAAFLRGSSPMGPMTGRHATYQRCHDIAEDEPIIIDTIIKTGGTIAS